MALFRVRPAFAAIPGVSAPPPFGGSNRTAVVHLDPRRLRSHRMSPDEVVEAIVRGNAVSPSGNVRMGDAYPIVPSNAVVKQAKELEDIAVRPGASPTVFVRDVGHVLDTSDINTGVALVNGKRTINLLVTKRSDASTLTVVNNLKAALPEMRRQLPEDVRLDFVFDQSPVVTGVMGGLAFEGLLGAGLTGLMVLLFLRDWRSAVVVVLNIPLALAAACIALWLTGQTLNIMTLGGLALAVGVLVDEAVVEIENIHAQMPGRARSPRPSASATR
jgi:multidrug efflux pump subunit AcrB